MFNGYDKELEKEVLGSCLNHHNDTLMAVTDLSQDDFGDQRNKEIFNTIKEVSMRSQKMPSISEIVFHFNSSAKDELLEFLVILKSECIGLDMRYMISLMFSLREARKISKITDATKMKYSNLKRAEYHDFVRNYQGEVFDQLQNVSHGTELSMRDFVASSVIYEKAVELQQLKKEGKEIFKGIPTGYLDIDEKIYGFAPGHFIVIGGRPGQGKTSFLLNLAAKMKSSKVAIFSLEMTAHELVEKLVLKECKIKYSSFAKGEISSNDVNMIYGMQKSLLDRVITIDDQSSLTPSQLYNKILRFQKLYGVDIVFIDYLQLMHGDEKSYESNQVKISSISRSLKAIAKECKIPIVALAQVNRASEQRQDLKPRMSDLRESGAIEADADIILLIHRPMINATTPKAGVVEVIIAKNRFGEVGAVELTFNAAIGEIENLSKQDQSEPNEAYSAFQPAK